jgi:hypothetical protein
MFSGKMRKVMWRLKKIFELSFWCTIYNVLAMTMLILCLAAVAVGTVLIGVVEAFKGRLPAPLHREPALKSMRRRA